MNYNHQNLNKIINTFFFRKENFYSFSVRTTEFLGKILRKAGTMDEFMFRALDRALAAIELSFCVEICDCTIGCGCGCDCDLTSVFDCDFVFDFRSCK